MSPLNKRLMLLKSSGMPELVNDLMYIFPYGIDDNGQIIIYTKHYDNGDGSVSRAEDLEDE
jgi:hypothetical protein